MADTRAMGESPAGKKKHAARPTQMNIFQSVNIFFYGNITLKRN
jgi:hypothetical protein